MTTPPLQLGQTFVPDLSIGPVWGVITAEGPESVPDHYYQWMQVDNDDDGKWRILPAREVEDGYGSAMFYDDSVGQILTNPAVEVNGNKAKIGQIVQLTPTRVIVDDYGNSHRAWMFVSDELRAFRLQQPVVPTGPVFNEDTAMPVSEVRFRQPIVNEGFRETTVEATWMDQPDPEAEHENATLYAPHMQGWPQGDQFLTIGIGTVEFNEWQEQGTTGWAKYVPKATIIDVDENGQDVWRGEWQIVSSTARTIVAGLVVDTLQPGEVGDFITWVHHRAVGGPQPRQSWTVKVYNNLPVPMTANALHNIHFDRELYVWLPVTPLATAHGLTIYASGTVSTTTNGDWVDVPLQDSMGTYGVELIARFPGIINRGEMTHIGHVSWSVSAERLFQAPFDPAFDVDSVLEIGLFNGGDLVPGSIDRISSSRRVPPELGTSAVNSAGGSNVIQLLDPGDMLQVKVRQMLSLKDGDHWRTLGNSCRLTFETVTSTFLRP